MEMSEKGGRRKEGGGLRKQKQNVKLQGDTWKQLILQMLTTQDAAGMGGGDSRGAPRNSFLLNCSSA